ncbi:hypothetical protein [Planomonospora parontospora]|uniref:hypothetical protein n=1 Tax=Planomonospora parontospora TaxID=58119 RepID=UPI0016700F3F|nr:hypothetical protein [Planomonospora parontospora]GGL57028.1 hypothetical protein GCM10014719_68030 [Planomonospora parontospora subsp. antibiotica]GII15150.1 hypothetical protein Ppa05_18760 [Planomonospora parontospora subsp. antibiotica]
MKDIDAVPPRAGEAPPRPGPLRNLVNQLWLPEGEHASWPVRVTDGTVPPGFRAVETYAVVPSPERARFLVPLSTRAAAVASVSRYNGLREPGTRMFRFLLGLGYRLGLAQRVVRHRLVVCVDERLDESALREYLLSAHLREVLGGGEVAIGAGVHRIDPHHKPVLQLFSLSGRPVAYVKVGWNDATRTMVATEAEALSAVAGMGEPHVPRLLHEGVWRDYRLTVTAPLPERIRRHREMDRPPAARLTLAVAESTGGHVGTLRGSAFLRRLREETALVAEEEAGLANGIAGVLDRVERTCGDVPLRFGRWHGDWVPWNIGWADGALCVWDWEHSGDRVPVGLDALHWRFQVAMEVRRLGLSEAVAAVVRAAPGDLAEYGVPEQVRACLAELYVVEMFLRVCRLKRGGGWWSERFHPHMTEELARMGRA